MSLELLKIKQERIPVLRNRVISAAAQDRWKMRVWATGEFSGTDTPDTQDFYSPENECNTAFCGAGWGAMDAGYVPAYAPETLSNGKTSYVISDTYVKIGAKVHDVTSEDFDWDEAGSPEYIAGKYFGLTDAERHFLFVEAHDVTDINRYAAMLDVVKDGNPSDFNWLYRILNGFEPVRKAEIDPNFRGAFSAKKIKVSK